jgi:hypothetical protein
MPASALKSLAKKSHVKMGRAEHLWDKAKQIVSKEYDYSHDDPRYWALVMGITKKMMGIGEDEKITFKMFIEDFNQGADDETHH